MGLFSGNKTTEQKHDRKSTVSTSTSTAPRSAQEDAMLNMLQEMSAGAYGQMGDLSGLARGELPELSEGMRATLGRIADEMQEREVRAADMAFEEGLNDVTRQAQAQGQGGSSTEAMFKAIAGRDRGRAVEDASSRAAQFQATQEVNMPFQIAGQMSDINRLLFGMATQPSQIALENLLRDRLANSETTQSTHEWGITANKESGDQGILSGLGAMAGSVMGIPGLNLPQLFGAGGNGGASAPQNMYSAPIGPSLSGAPMGRLSPARQLQGPGYSGVPIR